MGKSENLGARIIIRNGHKHIVRSALKNLKQQKQHHQVKRSKLTLSKVKEISKSIIKLA